MIPHDTALNSDVWHVNGIARPKAMALVGWIGATDARRPVLADGSWANIAAQCDVFPTQEEAGRRAAAKLRKLAADYLRQAEELDHGEQTP